MPSKRSDNNRLLIPEECRRVKADYATRPTDALVREIKQFIAATGKPHLWRGHTHTKPLVGSKPVYLDEFDLPLANLKRVILHPALAAGLTIRSMGCPARSLGSLTRLSSGYWAPTVSPQWTRTRTPKRSR